MSNKIYYQVGYKQTETSRFAYQHQFDTIEKCHEFIRSANLSEWSIAKFEYIMNATPIPQLDISEVENSNHNE